MKEILISKLQAYLIHNNPEILVALHGDSDLSSYLQEKVKALDDLPDQLLAEGKSAYIIEEICMDELTKGLRPSGYNYLLSILEDDFKTEYFEWREAGVLTYEIINLLQICNPVFNALEFSEENEDDRMLRYAIIGAIHKCLAGTSVEIENREILLKNILKN
jgi:Domain of unknown function (DUF1896)